MTPKETYRTETKRRFFVRVISVWSQFLGRGKPFHQVKGNLRFPLTVTYHGCAATSLSRNLPKAGRDFGSRLQQTTNLGEDSLP
jgi:hypothetical protein